MSIEQEVANWFRSRLSLINQEAGYSMPGFSAIYVDGEAVSEPSPAAPIAELVDDAGQWTEVGPADRHGVMQYQVAIRVQIAAKAATYKATARGVFDDLVRACSMDTWADNDYPMGVASILPDSWARQQRDGNYLEVVVTFNVRVTSDLRRRPLPV